jgi:putative transposase
VSTRGSFGQPLFQTPAEHELYLALYERYAAKFGWTTLAWSLLRNHHHFLIKLRDGGLSEGMRAINHGFSRRLNAAYGRTGTGHLVRHSFFAQRIDTDECLRSVMRYIDLNAVAARCCRQPEHWPWCSYPATAGLARARAFHDVRAALAVFGARPGRARTRYVRFVLDGMPGKGYEAATGQRLVVRSAA